MAEIKLSLATQRINQATLFPVSYNRVFLAVVSGVIPAVQRGGRWFVDEHALPHAVDYFVQHPAGRPSRQTRNAA